MDDDRALATIGHSNRSIDTFLGLLDAHGIDLLVDVRAFPGSRRLPHFGQEALAESLGDVGIAYEHVRELGGRRRTTDTDGSMIDVTGAWRNASFRAYAAYAQTPAYAVALERLEALASDARAAIMCSEAVPWRCHRWLVSDTLTARGWTVLHVLDEGPARRHEPSPFVRVEDDRVTWPGPESTERLRLGARVDGTGARRR